MRGIESGQDVDLKKSSLGDASENGGISGEQERQAGVGLVALSISKGCANAPRTELDIVATPCQFEE